MRLINSPNVDMLSYMQSKFVIMPLCSYVADYSFILWRHSLTLLFKNKSDGDESPTNSDSYWKVTSLHPGLSTRDHRYWFHRPRPCEFLWAGLRLFMTDDPDVFLTASHLRDVLRRAPYVRTTPLRISRRVERRLCKWLSPYATPQRGKLSCLFHVVSAEADFDWKSLNTSATCNVYLSLIR